MQPLAYKLLTPGATVDIIAPAGGCAPESLAQIKTLLKNWQLTPRISPELLGEDLLCANTDENRFKHLQEALFNAESSAVWCVRGGYGCTRLIPELFKLKTPKTNKLFIGFSDITTLHLFLQQQWHWQTLHGPSANQVAHDRIDTASIQEFKKLIFGELSQLVFSLVPLNPKQNHATLIKAPITGGTLTLIQTSLSTPWQIDTKDKILFLEEVNESAYRIDRMLQHLQHSGILQHVKAILLGDFIAPQDSKDATLIQAVLARFANEQRVPVLHIPGIGHGETNRSLPLGANTELNLDKKQLTITIG
ncbi:S66 peptidase family protein [Rickettsiella endosymbiont of Dermanyssus gallinae]|uniref:S66 peptidase family protein n=1 Tax=Rickettsiella endosymbiont of Dermanyssus gallinae TaxID=2856608 RepID=UPI001C5272B3|nr:LD-carboxypeptidase [Rickettsiella endosymbiont of Dermanyssus gallinae]